MIKKILGVLVLVGMIQGCSSQADIVGDSLAVAGDQFELNRRIIFHNMWSDKPLQVIEGRCSVEYGKRISVICKTGESSTSFKRSLVSVNEFTTIIVEQLDSSEQNPYHYRRILNPQAVIPDIDFRGDTSSALKAVTPDTKD